MWQGCVIRGDLNQVIIHNLSVIGPFTTIHTVASLGLGISAATRIMSKVLIGNHCSLCSCTIKEMCYVGPGCTILEGARLERGCVIAANSVVPPGRLIPAGQLWAGNPVEYVRALTQAEEVAQNAYLYSNIELGSVHRRHYYNTPNAYLDKITTKEDMQPSPQETVPHSYNNDDHLTYFRYL